MELAIYLIFLAFIVPAVYAAIIGAPTISSANNNIREVLKEAGVKKGTRFYELGTGTGNVSREALEMGAEVHGYELSPLAYLWSLVNLALTGKKFKLIFKNFFTEDLRNAEVVYAFLMPNSIARLNKKLEKESTKKVTLISYAFSVRDRDPIKEIRGNKMAPIYIYEIG